jgi:hypothetical protein
MSFKKPSRRSTKNQINSQEERRGVVFHMEALKGNEPDNACPRDRRKETTKIKKTVEGITGYSIKIAQAKVKNLADKFSITLWLLKC